MGAARFRVDAVAVSLQVTLGGGVNPLAVTTPANLVRGLKLMKSLLHRSELRIRGNLRVERRSDVLGGAVNARYVLEEADDFGHWLRERVIEFLGDGSDLRAQL